MIVVTGGAGFIGSALVWKLNQLGRDDIVVIDRLGTTDKWRNLVGLRFADLLHKDDFLRRIESGYGLPTIDAIVHLGACSSTTERDADYLAANNYRYSRTLAEWALPRDVRFIYASSAATYGDGALGYRDNEATTRRLRPLNAYGYSKHLFDLWALDTGALDKIAGLKFFNVFGPHEYHKGEMRSVVHKAFEQITATGRVQLFRSSHSDFGDGEQQRDFVYVKDCVSVIAWLIDHPVAGLFNLGTGRARTWNDLVGAVFAALGTPPEIEYIDMPAALRGKYQNHTEADMRSLAATGCPVRFGALEDTVADYVAGHLAAGAPYLACEPTQPAALAAGA